MLAIKFLLIARGGGVTLLNRERGLRCSHYLCVGAKRCFSAIFTILLLLSLLLL